VTERTDIYRELAGPDRDLQPPDRALAVGAHPDDIEFGAGGTLAIWAAAGCEVTMLIVTDGSKGTWDPAMSGPDLVAIRHAEQSMAGAALGAGDIIHLDHVDGELVYTMDLRREMCRHIRLAKPDVVLTHDPWQRYQLHPDHRATGWSVVDGVVSARDSLFFPEQGLDAHRPASILLWSADEPNHWVDIEAGFDAKVAALLCHSSQTATTMGGADLDENRRDRFIHELRDWAAQQGIAAGHAAAESFRRLVP